MMEVGFGFVSWMVGVEMLEVAGGEGEDGV